MTYLHIHLKKVGVNCAKMHKVFIFFGYFKLSLPFYYRVLFTCTELADIKTSGNKCRLYYKNASSNIYK